MCFFGVFNFWGCLFLGFKLGFGWFLGLENPEKVAKKRKKWQKFAEMCMKSALLGKKVLEKDGFLCFP